MNGVEAAVKEAKEKEMKKPKPLRPGHVFASEDDRYDYNLNCIAWLGAKNFMHMARECGPPHQALNRGEMAEVIRNLIEAGQFTIEIHPDNGRLVPTDGADVAETRAKVLAVARLTSASSADSAMTASIWSSSG